MDYYDVETPKGICRCYETKGIYYPLNESEIDIYMYEPIVNIEIVRENEDAGV